MLKHIRSKNQNEEVKRIVMESSKQFKTPVGMYCFMDDEVNDKKLGIQVIQESKFWRDSSSMDTESCLLVLYHMFMNGKIIEDKIPKGMDKDEYIKYTGGMIFPVITNNLSNFNSFLDKCDEVGEGGFTLHIKFKPFPNQSMEIITLLQKEESNYTYNISEWGDLIEPYGRMIDDMENN
tara:strand:- start:1602 stop:2138 length:537 start_codon:yes stop_codon:yes gene_type:complete